MRNILSRFRRDARGSVALVAGLSAIPLILAAGVAVDLARASHETQAFQSAIDAAALAVAASDQSDLSSLDEAQKTARLAELKTMAKNYIDANYTPTFYKDSQMNVTVAVAEDGSVSISADHQFPTTIMSIAGINEVDIKVAAQVKKAAGVAENVEIILVMDTTGSMGDSNKLVDAKAAAKALIKEVLGTAQSDEHVKFALVPFSGSVNVGSTHLDSGWIDKDGLAKVSRLNFTDATWHNAMAWTKLKYKDENNATQTMQWNGCVEARLGDFGIDDAPPSNVDAETLFTPYFAPDEPGGTSNFFSEYKNSYIGTWGTPNETTGLAGNASSLEKQKNQKKYEGREISPASADSKGPWYNCAASAIVPLTTERSTIEAGVDAMEARGNTVLPEGMVWGWRVMSPNAPFMEGAAYDDKEWRKVIVFMTDGQNDISNGVNSLNGSVYTSYGYVKADIEKNRFGTQDPDLAEGKLDDKLEAICDNIKEHVEMRPSAKDATEEVPSIEIYTIAFRAPEAAQDLLKYCATGGASPYYVNASDGQALKLAFKTIGERLKMMYLSK